MLQASILSPAFWNANSSLSPNGRAVVNSILGALHQHFLQWHLPLRAS